MQISFSGANTNAHTKTNLNQRRQSFGAAQTAVYKFKNTAVQEGGEKLGKALESKIEVYLLDKKDMPFLKMLMNALSSKKQIAQDSKGIMTFPTEKDTFKALVRRASELDSEPKTRFGIGLGSDGGVLIAIRDNNKIAGIADYYERGIGNDIRTLLDFEGKDEARNVLMTQLLKLSRKDFPAVSPVTTSKYFDTPQGADLFKKLGFIEDSYPNHQLYLSAKKVNSAVKDIKQQFGDTLIESKQRLTPFKEFDLRDVMDLK